VSLDAPDDPAPEPPGPQERQPLARHGLVERCGCEGDRRGIYVVLTEAGEQRHAEAAPTHRGVLARTLPAAMLTSANNRPG